MRREYNASGRELSGVVKCDFAYTGEEIALALPKGRYYLQCWGAQGGGAGSPGKQSTGGTDIGGWGGYSDGYLTLDSPTPFYIYVGGEGLSGSTNTPSGVLGGFNGGGRTIAVSGFSGGGASDFRIGSNSLYARVMVAGGGGGYGGGTDGASLVDQNGGNGGGYYAGSTDGAENSNYWHTASSGGTQTNGGNANAGFGYGGDSISAQSGSHYLYSSAGGGGWYGGGSSGYASSTIHIYNWNPCGGGGSGYIYNSTSAVNYPTGCLLSPSYYIENGRTIGGATTRYGTNASFSMPTVSSQTSTETGHRGDGYARISGITRVNVPEEITVSGIVEYYTESGVYDIPEWAVLADIFLVNGGNAGSGVSSNNQNGYGGQGGNYFSASSIYCFGSSANVTVGAGGVTGTNITGGTTILNIGGKSFSPQPQSNNGRLGTSGNTARSGVRNSVDKTDTVHEYGAYGGMGNYSSNTGRTGGNTSGGTGAGAYSVNASGSTPGRFYGAGGGGGALRAPNYGGNRPPSGGYQGIVIVRYRPV